VHGLNGGYGPLLMATQSFVFWGAAVVLCATLVFVPLATAGELAESLALVYGSMLAYEVVHLCAVYYKVHFIELRRYAELAFAQGSGPEDKA